MIFNVKLKFKYLLPGVSMCSTSDWYRHGWYRWPVGMKES